MAPSEKIFLIRSKPRPHLLCVYNIIFSPVFKKSHKMSPAIRMSRIFRSSSRKRAFSSRQHERSILPLRDHSFITCFLYLRTWCENVLSLSASIQLNRTTTKFFAFKVFSPNQVLHSFTVDARTLFLFQAMR